MPPRPRPPVHYLRANDSEWTPAQVITLDTETRWTQDPAGETHVLRLWAARLDSRRPDSTGWTGTVDGWGTTAGQLAECLDGWCRGQRTVWAFAHNLSFDLTVARIPLEMAALGWQVTDHAAGSETPWLRLKRGSCVLTLADSWGWLRQPISGVGAALGMGKPPLPPEDAGDEWWRARCEADRDILATALLDVMAWWDKAQLGRWSLTGSASGWNVMRHKMPARRVTIMPDEHGIAADRAAIHGGRRECFTWGEQEPGRYVEYDFTAAYPAIAANLPLPAKRLYPFSNLPLESPLIRGIGLGITARCLIETDHPRWPVRIGGRVWYPVGRFWANLAGPEIAEACRLNCLLSVGEGYAHALGWHLREWAQWVLEVQSGRDADAPAVAVPMVKHWGRAVIGKFAAHGFTKEAYGAAISQTWSYMPVWDIGRQAHGAIVELAGRRWKCLNAGDGDNAYPAVLAYVESYTRARLSRVIDHLTRGRVICCDTDGVLLRETAGDDIWPAPEVTDPLALRAKGAWRQVRVIGPQHLVRDGRRKFSGVPGSAHQLADGRLEALVWPRLAWQLGEHAGEGYRRPAQTYTVGASYASGWVDQAGTVWPVEVTTDAAGANLAVPWAGGRHDRAGVQLGAVQSPSVLRVFGTGEGL